MIVGKFESDGSECRINTPTFLKTHTFIQGMTGSGKTGIILKLVEESRKRQFIDRYGYIPFILIDYEGEFSSIPDQYDDFILLNNEWSSEYFTSENASLLGRRVRELGISVVVHVKDIGKKSDIKRFVADFTEGFKDVPRENWTPCIYVIDEADIFVPRVGKSPSKEIIIDACKRARKTNISIILATQFASAVAIEARSQCANRIAGKTVEPIHQEAIAQMFGDKKIKDELWNLPAGKFFVRGDAITQNMELVTFQESEVKKPEAGIIESKKRRNTEDVIKMAMNEKSQLPYSVVQQHKINELELYIKSIEGNILTKEEQGKIFQEGYNKGYSDAKNESIFRKLKIR